MLLVLLMDFDHSALEFGADVHLLESVESSDRIDGSFDGPHHDRFGSDHDRLAIVVCVRLSIERKPLGRRLVSTSKQIGAGEKAQDAQRGPKPELPRSGGSAGDLAEGGLVTARGSLSRHFGIGHGWR